MKPELLGKTLIAACAALVLAACASTPHQESTGEVLDDTVITTKVKTAFVQDQMVAATRISVETFKGIVQLSGFAKSREEAERAEQIARAVPGVKEVKNEIGIR